MLPILFRAFILTFSLVLGARASEFRSIFWSGNLEINNFNCEEFGFSEIFIMGSVTINSIESNKTNIYCNSIRFAPNSRLDTANDIVFVVTGGLAGDVRIFGRPDLTRDASSESSRDGRKAPDILLAAHTLERGASLEIVTRGEDGSKGATGAQGQRGSVGTQGSQGRDGRNASILWPATGGENGGRGGAGRRGGRGAVGGKGGDGGLGGNVTVVLVDEGPNSGSVKPIRNGGGKAGSGGTGGLGGQRGAGGRGGLGGKGGQGDLFRKRGADGHSGPRGVTGSVGPRGLDGPPGKRAYFGSAAMGVVSERQFSALISAHITHDLIRQLLEAQGQD